ncbi:MAG TPA: GNAT family N-acetyltransferase [Rhodoferax sp.]
MTELTVAWRPVTMADHDFLLGVYACTRAMELALTDWDAATCDAFVRMQFHAQTTYYQQQWPLSEQSVIKVDLQGDAKRVGRLWVDRRSEVIHVLDIALLPEWCGQGVGSLCLTRLMHEGVQSGRALTIQVEQGNPARRLYERLGFQSVGSQQGLHQLMAWREGAAAALHPEEACDEQA